MAVANAVTNGTNGHAVNISSSPTLPIVISGGGCVGLFLALLLANSSISNKIIVIESQTPDVTSTRAMAHQPPTFPILSRVPGLLPELIKAGSLSSGLCFRTSIANGSKVIAEKCFNNEGEGMKGKGQLLLPQGKFQDVLMKRLAITDDTAEVRIGSSVTGFNQNFSSVSVTISDTHDSTTLEASYLLAADGAHSLIRKTLDIPFEGDTLDAQLVALDLQFPFSEHGFHDANFIIDPINYGLIGRILPATSTTPALWRVSYGAPLRLSEAQIKDGVDEKLQVMLPNAGRNENGEIGYEVVRIAPYKAQQLLASTLYTNRVCLVGDAAHLTNPYAGLGLASGIADAASLAEVLEHVLSGAAKDAETTLQAWSKARRQKFSNVVDKSSRMAYKRVRSDVETAEKVQDLLSRDPMVAALKKGMPVIPPSLETKGEELEGW